MNFCNRPLFFVLKVLLSKLLLVAFIGAAGQQKMSADADNYARLVSRSDLTYTTPVARSEEGMPVGNGTMGSLVWTTPTSLRFQINRVDVFAMNASSNNFYQRHTDYCNGVAFVDIDFSAGIDDIFTSPDFNQHLSCFNGEVSTQGKGIETNVMAWMQEDVMVVEVHDKRANPAAISINLRTLRAPISQKGNHSAISMVSIVDDHIALKQEFTEDNYYAGSSLVIGIAGREGKPVLANDSEVKIVVPPGEGKFVVFIASDASFDRNADLKDSSTKKLLQAKELGIDKLADANRKWWSEFWHKSYVHLHSSDGVADRVEKNYTYYLYVMASSSRGKYPTKFNGMLWTTGGDQRKWGSLFWGANQSCLYNALFSTNHIELLDPMFNMYTSMITSCSDAAVKQWGSKGLFIAETVAFDGLGELPDEIGAEMQSLYLLKKPWEQRSTHFVEYADTKLPFLSRWNWKKDDGWIDGEWHTSDKGGGAFGHVTHIFSRGAKIAYQYWLKYEYTQDMNWLRNNAYPVLKGVAEFYRNFPNVRKESDGRYHIYHVNDNESIWGGHNTVEEIASMMGILPVAIKAAEILNVDPQLRDSWKEFLENLSPLPERNEKGITTWKRASPPMIQGEGDRLPDPNTLPIWFFDLCTLESGEEMRAIANATFDSYFPQGIEANKSINVLSKLPVAGSLLGRKESTKYLIPNQIRTAESPVMPNRMDLREGEQTTSIQRLGRAAEALQYALCQSIPSSPGSDPVIHVFPAWPDDWEAQFSLLVRGGFLVSSSIQKERIAFVDIQSEHGKECRLRNPWPGNEVQVYRNGKKWKRLKGELFQFPTKENDRFTITPANSSIQVNRGLSVVN